jgi:hypothetical protein
MLPSPTALDPRPSSQLFVLMLANLLSSFLDDAAHKPPSLSPLTTLPTSALLPSRLCTPLSHCRDDHYNSRLKRLYQRISRRRWGLSIASSRGAWTCAGFPWRIQINLEGPGTGYERKEIALTPVGENVLLRSGCDVSKASSSRSQCIFERSRAIKSSSFCCSPAGTHPFPLSSADHNFRVQEPRLSSHTP